MTYKQRIEQLREEWKWATPTRRASIECLVKSIQIKHGIYQKEKRDLKADIKETLL